MNKNTSMVLIAVVAGIMVAGALAVTLQTSNAYAQCLTGQPGGHGSGGLDGGLSIGGKGNGGSANGANGGDANGGGAQNSQGGCSTNN
jgi:hypothetical protein